MEAYAAFAPGSQCCIGGRGTDIAALIVRAFSLLARARRRCSATLFLDLCAAISLTPESITISGRFDGSCPREAGVSGFVVVFARFVVSTHTPRQLVVTA